MKVKYWIKSLLRVVLFAGGLALFIFVLALAGEQDRKYCEEDLAQKMNTTAVYVGNHCMVKGYGRYDGR